MLDHDQRIGPLERHSIEVEEVDRQGGLRLGGEELMPGRAGSAGCGVDAGIVQNLPDRGGGDAVAESNQLAVHAPVTPGGILGGPANDQLPEGRRCRGAAGTAAGGVVPASGDPWCQARTVAGVTGKSWSQRGRGRSRDSAASHIRSVGV